MYRKWNKLITTGASQNRLIKRHLKIRTFGLVFCWNWHVRVSNKTTATWTELSDVGSSLFSIYISSCNCQTFSLGYSQVIRKAMTKQWQFFENISFKLQLSCRLHVNWSIDDHNPPGRSVWESCYQMWWPEFKAQTSLTSLLELPLCEHV